MDCGNVEDIAEIIGEISGSLNGSSSSIFLHSFDNIKYCLQNCLSRLEKSSWTKAYFIVRDEKLSFGLISEDYEYDNSDGIRSTCQLISIIRSLITHLRNHLSTTDTSQMISLQVKPSTFSLVSNPCGVERQQIIVDSQDFSVSFFKYYYEKSCHNCDVAAVLLHILSSYFGLEDIYSNNSNNNSIQNQAFVDDNALKRCTIDEYNFSPILPIIENPESSVKLVDQDQEPPTASMYEESCRLHSEMDPIKADQASSESQSGVCMTMPPDFRMKEEKRKGSIIYGNMERVLELLKERKNERMDFGSLKNKVTGVILHKYKKIIRVKSYESYDEGIHFIKVTSPLGSGCSGKCYLAIDNSSRRGFCLKIVKSLETSEIEVWATLNDVKGIPKFYGIMFHTDYVYIFQEFIHGPTLQSIITQSQSRMDVRSSLKILKELLVTLSELHQKDIIHNDVKADNIILGKRQVLLDFGLSVKSGNGVRGGVSPCGSQCHWSPEKAASEQYGVESDVWAAIVVFVHMLSGIEPWLIRFKNSKALHYIIKTKSPPLDDVPDDIPNDVLDLIKRGWTVDAHLRASAVELIKHTAFDCLEKFYQGESIPSLGLMNRSGSEKMEDLINNQLREGEQLLLSLPEKIKESDYDACDDTLKNDSLFGECNKTLAELATVPNHMIHLSKEIFEELKLFLRDFKNDGKHDDDNHETLLPHDKMVFMNEFKTNSFQSKIPVTVEEHSLSSENSEEETRQDNSQTSEALAVVLLEDGTQIYSCNLSLGSDTKWLDVAERCSADVHNRNIPRFYLTLYPSGKKIIASENVIETLTKELKGINTKPIHCQHPYNMQHLKIESKQSQKIIKAKVVEIQSDVQSWDWKVENHTFTFSYGSCLERSIPRCL